MKKYNAQVFHLLCDVKAEELTAKKRLDFLLQGLPGLVKGDRYYFNAYNFAQFLYDYRWSGSEENLIEPLMRCLMVVKDDDSNIEISWGRLEESGWDVPCEDIGVMMGFKLARRIVRLTDAFGLSDNPVPGVDF